MDKMYLYNGIELPSLPEWDDVTYPYAAIVSATFPYKAVLYVSKIPFTYKKDVSGVMLVFGSEGYMSCGCSMNDEWNGFSVFDTEFRITALDWTNTDIFNEDGSVYLPASDPVPVGGVPALTARDLYRKINGKPTKLTLYKKLGGKLVALDEHTKEVKT